MRDMKFHEEDRFPLLVERSGQLWSLATPEPSWPLMSLMVNSFWIADC
jgi:hypothetical protein